MLWYLYLFIFIYNFHLLLRFLTSLYHLWWIKPFIILSFCAAQRKLCRSWSKDNWQLSQLVAKLLKLNRTPTISCIRLLLAAYFNTEMSLSVPKFTTIPSLRLSNEVRASLCKFRALPRLWQCRRLSSVPTTLVRQSKCIIIATGARRHRLLVLFAIITWRRLWCSSLQQRFVVMKSALDINVSVLSGDDAMVFCRYVDIVARRRQMIVFTADYTQCMGVSEM